MSLPVTVPFTFGNATTTQSLSSLDTNFTTITNSVNGLTNGASQINVASISATGTANSTTFLRGDGTWGTPAGGGGSGTVTSVNVNGGTTGLTTTGGPVTTSGNITIAGTLIPANGGTGLTSVGASGNVLTSNGTVWLSSAGAYPLTSGTAVASTSGTSITFTGIPSWVKRITVMLNGVSVTGSSYVLIQIGSGSTTTSGYVGSGTNTGTGVGALIYTVSYTNAFGMSGSSPGTGNYNIIGTLVNISGNNWIWSCVGNDSGTAVGLNGAGKIALGGVLDRVVFAASTSSSTMSGTDTYDAGSINIMYE